MTVPHPSDRLKNDRWLVEITCWLEWTRLNVEKPLPPIEALILMINTALRLASGITSLQAKAVPDLEAYLTRCVILEHLQSFTVTVGTLVELVERSRGSAVSYERARIRLSARKHVATMFIASGGEIPSSLRLRRAANTIRRSIEASITHTHSPLDRLGTKKRHERTVSGRSSKR